MSFFLLPTFLDKSFYLFVGYGNISPRTSSGRGVAIFFSLFGIPLTVLVVRNISTKLTNSVVKIVRFFYKAKENVNNIAANQEKRLSLGISPRLRSKIKEWKISDKRKAKRGIYRFSSSDRKTKIACIVVLLFMVILFLLVSAGLRVLSEGWTMYESIYFWFITLTTVGFGDFVPYEGRKPSSVAATVIYYSGTFYLLIGLALIASLIQCISVMLEGRLPAVASSDNENKSKEISDSKPVELPDGTQNPAPHTRFSQIFIENVEQCDRINTNGAKSTGQNISHAVLESSTALFSFFVPSRHSNSGQGKTEDPQ